MARYFLELAYNGRNYNGWQIQPNAISVQQTIEESLSKLLSSDIKIVGCGRTDTGVNASYYTAHFESDLSEKIECEGFLYHLNSILPRDIAVDSVKRVDNDIHARFSAHKREYKYYIYTKKSPFYRDLYQYYVKLDVDNMNLAAQKLLKYDDFTSFAKLHSDNSTNICKIFEAYWEIDGNLLTFTISANRFLRNMVRAITGTLLDVGKGKLSVDEFEEIILSKNNGRASSSAPACGLYLTAVEY